MASVLRRLSVSYNFASRRFSKRVSLSRSLFLEQKHNSQISSNDVITSSNHRSKKWTKFGVAFAAGLGLGTVGLFYTRKTRGHTETLGQLTTPVTSSPSRSIVIDGDKSGLKLTLYQYQTCPFCCKVRTFLDYSGLSYDIVEVNPVLRQQIKFSKWRKVPIVIVKHGEEYHQLNDSSLIVSVLQSYLLDRSKRLPDLTSFYPVVSYTNENGKDVDEILNRYYVMYGDKSVKSKEYLEEERKWRQWADEKLVHMLSPNVYRSPSEALQAFRWFSEVGEWEKNFSALERQFVIYVGALAMYLIGKRLKKRHSLKEDVRESLYDACDEWVKGIGKERSYLGGAKPNLADLAVYGVLTSIEGCDAFGDILSNTDINSWFNRMKVSVKSHSGSAISSQ